MLERIFIAALSFLLHLLAVYWQMGMRKEFFQFNDDCNRRANVYNRAYVGNLLTCLPLRSEWLGMTFESTLEFINVNLFVVFSQQRK